MFVKKQSMNIVYNLNKLEIIGPQWAKETAENKRSPNFFFFQFSQTGFFEHSNFVYFFYINPIDFDFFSFDSVYINSYL